MQCVELLTCVVSQTHGKRPRWTVKMKCKQYASSITHCGVSRRQCVKLEIGSEIENGPVWIQIVPHGHSSCCPCIGKSSSMSSNDMRWNGWEKSPTGRNEIDSSPFSTFTFAIEFAATHRCRTAPMRCKQITCDGAYSIYNSLSLSLEALQRRHHHSVRPLCATKCRHSMAVRRTCVRQCQRRESEWIGVGAPEAIASIQKYNGHVPGVCGVSSSLMSRVEVNAAEHVSSVSIRCIDGDCDKRMRCLCFWHQFAYVTHSTLSHSWFRVYFSVIVSLPKEQMSNTVTMLYHLMLWVCCWEQNSSLYDCDPKNRKKNDAWLPFIGRWMKKLHAHRTQFNSTEQPTARCATSIAWSSVLVWTREHIVYRRLLA